MSFKLTSQFTIGAYTFNGGVNEVEIRRTVKTFVDTAVITLPALGIANNSAKLPENSVKTSTLFKPGDPVTIQLGYNYQNSTEFKGFVRRVSPSIPVKIECEGYAWQLRGQTFAACSYPSISLLQLLTNLAAGTNIKLSPDIPNWPLSNFKSPTVSKLEVLQYLQEQCRIPVYFLFDTIYAGLEMGCPSSTGVAPDTRPVPVHQLGWNTMRDEKLKWREVSDTPVQVWMLPAKGKNKKRPLYKAGPSGGSVVKNDIANISDQAVLQTIANDELARKSYTGYEGSITGFLQPYIQMCDTANLVDPMYNVREGRYFTQGTTVRFGVNGATREIFLGAALS
jgi:hypothetical protein